MNKTIFILFLILIMSSINIIALEFNSRSDMIGYRNNLTLSTREITITNVVYDDDTNTNTFYWDVMFYTTTNVTQIRCGNEMCTNYTTVIIQNRNVLYRDTGLTTVFSDVETNNNIRATLKDNARAILRGLKNGLTYKKTNGLIGEVITFGN
jgi:hypothetical protein